jgi:hypothetical protein
MLPRLSNHRSQRVEYQPESKGPAFGCQKAIFTLADPAVAVKHVYLVLHVTKILDGGKGLDVFAKVHGVVACFCFLAFNPCTQINPDQKLITTAQMTLADVIPVSLPSAALTATLTS